MTQYHMLKDHTSFFIVTPCFNGMPWLPGCVASVRNQISDIFKCYDLGVKPEGKLKPKTENLKHRFTEPIRVHHHVQDGGSTDGTVDWLKEYVSQQPSTDNYQLTFTSEADEGMYDAINRGWDRADASVDWLGHLNSDEQYQPGLLSRMAGIGGSRPKWGAITGNFVCVDGEGGYMCSRKPSVGWPWVGRIWIPAATCAFFIRRRFYGDNGVRFDTSWKSLGDKVFCRDLLNAGCRFGYLDEYLSVFVHRGDENLGHQPITAVEKVRYRRECLNSMQRLFEPVSIFAGKASRAWRTRLGRKCRSYRWIDSSGDSREIDVSNHRWKI